MISQTPILQMKQQVVCTLADAEANIKANNISKNLIFLCFSDTLFEIEKSSFILRLFYKVKQLFDTSLFCRHQTSP